MSWNLETHKFAEGVVAWRLVPRRRSAPVEVDLLQAGDLELRLKSEVNGGAKNLVVDLHNVSYVHSRALWALSRAGAQLEEKRGRIVVVAPSTALQHLLESTSAGRYITIRPHLKSAMELLGLKSDAAAWAAPVPPASL